MKLDDRVVLQWVVDRSRLIPGIDTVAVATSDAANDDEIVGGAPTMESTAIADPRMTLARFETAARAENADIIMRITADSVHRPSCFGGRAVATDKGGCRLRRKQPSRSLA